MAAVDKGEPDLALVVGHAKRTARTLDEVELVWIADHTLRLRNDRPVPPVMFGPQCAFRQAAIQKLDATARPWHIAAVAPSLPGSVGYRD